MSEALNTYSSHPFTSYDGPDKTGLRAEIRVVKGYGRVSEIENSKNGKASNVVFSVDNSKYTSKGWAPNDSKVIKKIKEAQESGEPIHFRLESRRKDNIDRSIPIDELLPKGDMTAARENTFKSLAAVKFEEDTDWTISPHALTRIDEDPSTGGGNSAYDHSLEELQGASQKSSSNSSNYDSGSNYGIESTPFHTRNSNGDVNPGSVAVAAPLNIFNFVAEWNRTHDDVTLSDKKIIAITKAILATSNRLQVDIYDGVLESPDLRFGSHTRARALIFDVTRNYFPITDEIVSSKESLQEWVDSVYSKSLAMWKWSISEIDKLS